MGEEERLILEEASAFDVICFFGFDRKRVCLENNLKEKNLVFFDSKKEFLSEASESCVYEIQYDGARCDLASFQELCREKFFLSFFYAVHPEVKGAAYQEAHVCIKQCQMVQWQCHLIASDYQDFGLEVFTNNLKSAEQIIDCHSFPKFKNSLKGIPAFICGAGPSLNEEIDRLKSLSNRGVVFAGGASLGCLTKAGVPVHIATGIDPDSSYERALMQGSFDIPFFCQSRFSSSLLQTIHGPVFQVPSNPGYKLQQWMDGGSVFDGGWTVGTFSMALAIHFGCNPIVLVGMDLSYSVNSPSYAGGIGKEEEGIIWDDPLEGSLVTQKDWILASKWIEEKVQSSCLTSFYNTSLRGLYLKGVKKSSLNDLLETELTKRYDIQGFIGGLCSCFEASRDRKENISLLKKSLESSSVFLDKLLHLYEKNYPADPSSKGEFVVNLFDLYDEIVYQEILEPLWQVWQFPVERNLPDSYAKDINRFLFFKKILQEYGRVLWK